VTVFRPPLITNPEERAGGRHSLKTAISFIHF
jgi:hypothetical protein